VKEYDVFVPLNYNDGKPIEGRKFKAIQMRLLEQFKGLNIFPQANKGFWKMAGLTFRDEIVIYRVLSSNARSSRRFFAELKAELKRDLKQQEILIVEREIQTI
jgi:hypothetical protein